MGVAQCCQEPAVQPSFFGYKQNVLQQLYQLKKSQQVQLHDKKGKINEEIAIDMTSLGFLTQNLQKSRLKQNEKNVSISTSNLPTDQQQFIKTINGRLNDFSMPDKQILMKKLFQVKKSQFKHLPLLKINILKSPQNQIKKTYYLRFDSSFYIGQWKYHTQLKSDIPYGIGRLYKNSELLQGTFKTFVQIQDFKNQQSHFLMRSQNQNQNRNESRMTRQVQKQKAGLHVKLEIFLDGIGRYVTAKGQQYNGQYTKGKLNGKGFYKNISIEYYYQGNWQSGLRQGKGTQKTKLTFYDGGYKQDKKSGKGSLIFYLSHKQQQQRLEEQKKLNKTHDKFTQSEQKKQITKKLVKIKRIYSLIDNEFKEKKQQILNLNTVNTNKKSISEPWDFPSVCQNQNFIYEHESKTRFLQKYIGQFQDDIIDGNGSYQWNNGKYYNGDWKQGQMQGNGQYYVPFGIIYKGQFKNDKKHGKGQSIYNLNQIYRGSWAFDLKHGYGQTFIYQQNEDSQGKKTAKLIVRGSKWDKSKQVKAYFNIQIQDPAYIQPQIPNQIQTKHLILNKFLNQAGNSGSNKNVFSIDQKSQDLQSN